MRGRRGRQRRADRIQLLALVVLVLVVVFAFANKLGAQPSGGGGARTSAGAAKLKPPGPLDPKTAKVDAGAPAHKDEQEKKDEPKVEAKDEKDDTAEQLKTAVLVDAAK